MSGFLGIFHRDGKPVDQDLLNRLKEKLSYRGPDAQQAWHAGSVGMVHALFRSTWEQTNEHQPLTLDNRSWLAGDIRLDRREGLVTELGDAALETGPDCELVLRAYLRWGEACIEHLAGDFAFAVWNSTERKLFMARDHFGIKQLYYYETPAIFAFSNDLDRLLDAGVPKDVNDQALVDFLMFGHNRVVANTPYVKVRRLPAAHAMVVTRDNLRISRYFTLAHKPIRYRRKREYVDHFRDLLVTAVNDRLRADRATVFMSGGMDSTTIAAIAMRAQRDSRKTQLQAITVVEEILQPDPEHKFSKIAAESIGIPHHVRVLDGYKFFQDAENVARTFPQPQEVAFGAVPRDLYRQAAAFGRVGLDGCGSDPALQATHADEPFSAGLAMDILFAVPRLWIAHRRAPRIGVRTALRRISGKETPIEPPSDEWLRPEHRRDEEFQERRKNFYFRPTGTNRVAAFDMILDPLWEALFERIHLTGVEVGLEIRFPFMFRELIAFSLSIPSLPWFVEKHILREASKVWLPTSVRLRPKTRVLVSQTRARSSDVQQFLSTFRPSERLQSMLDWDLLLRAAQNDQEGHAEELIKAISLDRWFTARGLT